MCFSSVADRDTPSFIQPYTLSIAAAFSCYLLIIYFTLIDASDWDSASTASKRTLSSRRLASPGGELPECSRPSFQEEEQQKEEDPSTARLTPQKSHDSPEASPQHAVHPQPRARKLLLLHKPESEEGQRCNRCLSTPSLEEVSLQATDQILRKSLF